MARVACGGAGVPARLSRTVTSLGRATRALDRFTRIHFVGYTCLYPLLGAASVAPTRGASFWFGLAAIGVFFNSYGCVLNDVVDLPVDRTQPARAQDPLVRGAISPRQALAFALAQVPVCLAVSTWLGAGLAAQAWLAGAFGAMAVYDVYGKRCPFPPLSDAAQGVSWVCMTGYGATLAGGSANLLTLVVAGTGILYTLLINGVHGGMRDLANDQACGARTTALWLGMRPVAGGGIRVPARAAWFCWPLLVLLLALSALSLAREPVPPWGARLAGGIGMLVTSAGCVWGMARVLRPERAGWQVIFRLHLVVLLLPMLSGVLPHLPPVLGLGIVLLFLTPLGLLVHAGSLKHRSIPPQLIPRDEVLIAVNERDEELGPLSRERCHDGAGILHRAFSVYLFDAEGRVLLQRRSARKRLWPLYWSNSCCSHPRWEESIDAAAHRRVGEELGVEVALRRVFGFAYQAEFGSLGSERELCSVYVGRLSTPVHANPEEIAELRFASVDEVNRELKIQGDSYTPWFRIGWQKLLQEHKAEVAPR